MIPLGRYAAAGSPSRSATSASSSATTPPSPYRSTAVSGGMVASRSAGRTGPCPPRARSQERRRVAKSAPVSSSTAPVCPGQAARVRALLFESFGGPLTVQQVPDPTPAPGGVVVRVGATGICRSDWHGWQGHDPDVVLPHVPGHELAG